MVVDKSPMFTWLVGVCVCGCVCVCVCVCDLTVNGFVQKHYNLIW
jgi:hypothetical protein